MVMRRRRNSRAGDHLEPTFFLCTSKVLRPHAAGPLGLEMRLRSGEVARCIGELRLPSGEVAMCIAESATQGAPGGPPLTSFREASPGGPKWLKMQQADLSAPLLTGAPQEPSKRLPEAILE